jgi:hypothetical protein
LNEVIVGGSITQKTKLYKSHGNLALKFILDDRIFCLAINKKAEQVNDLKSKSVVVCYGKVLLIHNNVKKTKTNVVYVEDIELYTEQPKRRKKT